MHMQQVVVTVYNMWSFCLLSLCCLQIKTLLSLACSSERHFIGNRDRKETKHQLLYLVCLILLDKTIVPYMFTIDIKSKYNENRKKN